LNNSPISRYEYPVPSKAEKAQSETVEIVDASLKICVDAVNRMPRSPYGEDQVEK
jgi:hypothetical protein